MSGVPVLTDTVQGLICLKGNAQRRPNSNPLVFGSVNSFQATPIRFLFGRIDAQTVAL
jgi:hypothetical protein